MNKEELKEGMYVRTNDGFIAKFIEIKSYPVCCNDAIRSYGYIFDGQVWDSRLTDGYYDHYELTDSEIEQIKMSPSFDIIDLIKPGDYVNGKKVIVSGYNRFDEWCVAVESKDDLDNYIYPKDIKTILTKEQYEMNCYEVKNENI